VKGEREYGELGVYRDGTEWIDTDYASNEKRERTIKKYLTNPRKKHGCERDRGRRMG